MHGSLDREESEIGISNRPVEFYSNKQGPGRYNLIIVKQVRLSSGCSLRYAPVVPVESYEHFLFSKFSLLGISA